jgi:isopenicillin N synthase-like dioxygenase
MASAAAEHLRGAVPTIDFSAFPPTSAHAHASASSAAAPPTPEQLATAARIDAACRVHGFLKLRHVGITPADTAAAFDAAKTLFALPEAHKADASSLAHFTAYPPGANRGYFPVRPSC